MKYKFEFTHEEISDIIRDYMEHKYKVPVSFWKNGVQHYIPVNFSVIVGQQTFDNILLQATFEN